MMSDTHDCLAAFADGEPVDPGLLDRALADPEARAYLIDLLALRGLYGRRAAGPEPGRTAGEPGAAAMAPVEPPTASATTTRGRWLPAIAALITVSVLGGYIAGRQSASRPSIDRPTASQPAPTGTVTAPAPTQIIRLEPGVDWNERGGGD
jgi:hypothetical protein